MGKILTFTGASGAGKTTIVKELLKGPEQFYLVTSTTTRSPRPSDLPGEYNYISNEEFELKRKNGSFLWEFPFPGKIRHGTLYESINEVFVSQIPFIMILVPATVPKLIDYVGKNAVLSFYIRSAPEEILRSRMQQRGDSPDGIENRLQECRNWDEQAEKSGIPYIFITNNGTVEETVEKVKGYLK